MNISAKRWTILLSVFCFVLAWMVSGCSNRVEMPLDEVASAEAAISKAADEGKYLLLYFYEQGSRDSKKMLKVIEKAKAAWSERAHFKGVDLADDGEKDTVIRYGIRKAPVTLVIAPNGAVTAGFGGVVDLKELETGFVSPQMSEIIKGIQEEKTIFLCMGNAETRHFQEVVSAANEAVEMLEGIAKVIEVDPSDEKEEHLFHQTRIEKPLKEVVTLVISPRGSVVDKLTGEIGTRQLFDSFEKILAMPSGCGAPTVTGGSSCQPGKGAAGKSGCN